MTAMKDVIVVLALWSIYSAAEMFYFHPKEINLALRTATNTAQLACVKERLADNKGFRETLNKIIKSIEAK